VAKVRRKAFDLLVFRSLWLKMNMRVFRNKALPPDGLVDGIMTL
jgi:hypothetical protein